MDPRHKKRIKLTQEIYTRLFPIPSKNNKNLISKKTDKILSYKKEIDILLKKYAQKFPIENVSKVDLSILYLTVYELLFEKKEPPKVIIDEAVELAKELGGERSYAFVNAILGKIYKRYHERKN